MNKYIAEAIGTFALVFCGTGAIIIDGVSGGALGTVGIAITFGLIVMAMIAAVGEVSGAHFNPAVTIGFWVSKRFEGNEVLPYITAQAIGAFFASGVLRFLYLDDGRDIARWTLASDFCFRDYLNLLLNVCDYPCGDRIQGARNYC